MGGMSSPQILIWPKAVFMAWFGKFNNVAQQFGMTGNEADH